MYSYKRIYKSFWSKEEQIQIDSPLFLYKICRFFFNISMQKTNNGNMEILQFIYINYKIPCKSAL